MCYNLFRQIPLRTNQCIITGAEQPLYRARCYTTSRYQQAAHTCMFIVVLVRNTWIGSRVSTLHFKTQRPVEELAFRGLAQAYHQ